MNDQVIPCIAACPEERKGSQEKHAGVLGATSFVGASLLPLLTAAGWQATAFTRKEVKNTGAGVVWQHLDSTASSSKRLPPGIKNIEAWISVAPIWVLPDYFWRLEALGAKRLVVLSSTSRFSKQESNDPKEQATALHFVEGEARVRAWAESRGVEWVILRPTLIYGLGRDKNIGEIARFIRRFGFFPLFGQANGLRQPIHAADVAGACLAALQAPCAANHVYNISGGETLSYREMVTRVFVTLAKHPRLLTVPLWAFRLAVAPLRRLQRYRLWSAAMAERMNRDLVFDHAEAARDLGFKPRAFVLTAGDLPK